jgi:hypothetical protein
LGLEEKIETLVHILTPLIFLPKLRNASIFLQNIFFYFLEKFLVKSFNVKKVLYLY